MSKITIPFYECTEILLQLTYKKRIKDDNHSEYHSQMEKPWEEQWRKVGEQR